jgi:hypothetical protein
MSEGSEAFVGLDTSKTKISVAVADGGRCGEVRFYGDIDSSPDAVNRLVKKLSAKYQCLHFCYDLRLRSAPSADGPGTPV